MFRAFSELQKTKAAHLAARVPRSLAARRPR
jgi:hypothetical protein